MVFNNNNSNLTEILFNKNPIDNLKLKLTTTTTTTTTTTGNTHTNSKLNKMNNLNDLNAVNIDCSNAVNELASSSRPGIPIGSSGSSGGGGGGKKKLSNEDKKINLNALKNQDPFATNIVDMAFRVAVYKFVSKKNEWKKLDVEGSLFVFERMVEPLHSFVVMNTLALHLFLQPITYDLEFQDRNPFLLYKSNNDIFGIWFIDKEDCERIKSLIIGLTESARERRIKREESKMLNMQQQQQKIQTCSSLEKSNFKKIEIPRLVTPTSLLETGSFSSSSSSASSTSSSCQLTDKSCTSAYEQFFSLTKPAPTSSSSSGVDIMQMLTKAQLEYTQLQSDSSSCFLNAATSPQPLLEKWSTDLISAETEFVKPTTGEQTHLPISLNLSSMLALSPSASSASSSSTGYSTSSSTSSAAGFQANQAQKKLNPILQKLLHQAPNQHQSDNKLTNDLLSAELKQKLNIKPSNSQQLASSTMITTPSNPLILGGYSGLHLADSAVLKRPMTLKDFEENLLNESSTSTPANANISTSPPQAQQKPLAMFYIGNESISNFMRPNSLLVSKKDSKKVHKAGSSSSSSKKKTYVYSSGSEQSSAASTLSSRSRASSSSSSSDSSSSSTSSSDSSSSSGSSSSGSSSSSSPRRALPLLLTPAAFETSSISSSASTSSSSKTNIFNDFLNSQLMSSIDHQQKLANKLHNKHSYSKTSSHKQNNLVFADNTQLDAVKPNDLVQQYTVLNKPQLQHVLIHLLTTDDKFLSSLHQAYLATNNQQAASHPVNLKPLLFNESNSASIETITAKNCHKQQN